MSTKLIQVRIPEELILVWENVIPRGERSAAIISMMESYLANQKSETKEKQLLILEFEQLSKKKRETDARWSYLKNKLDAISAAEQQAQLDELKKQAEREKELDEQAIQVYNSVKNQNW